jgi:hypothetical protein
MIIAGSIVGSGELIATTKAGAEAGFWLLWLIIFGCVIKVSTQIELGRYTITWTETPLKALDSVPGPRLKVNWVLWYWVVMTVIIISQQGGIIGGVGQALAISRPLTDQGQQYNQLQDELTSSQVELKVAEARGARKTEIEQLERKIAKLTADTAALDKPTDAYLWATILAVATSVLLLFGRYGLIQFVSTVFVAAFTVVTIATLIMLQTKPEWAVTGGDLADGLSFRLPPASEEAGINPIATTLAAFGIIGVGASELIMYPYWCLEKGYAQFAGPRERTQAWIQRARGWLRVLQFDAWFSQNGTQSRKRKHGSHAGHDVCAGLWTMGGPSVPFGGVRSAVLDFLRRRGRKRPDGGRLTGIVRDYRRLRANAIAVDTHNFRSVAASCTPALHRLSCACQNDPCQRYGAGNHAANAGSRSSIFSLPSQ